jgi:hypothetical protein
MSIRLYKCNLISDNVKFILHFLKRPLQDKRIFSFDFAHDNLIST